jgi:enamine deaminase RidA (YjgF/YER057c/UK114 family)
MHYIVYRLDDPANSERIRQSAVRADHLAFMKSIRGFVKSGGPILDEDEQAPIGGLMIIEATSLSAVKELIASDPYTRAGLWRSISVHPWRWQTNPLNRIEESRQMRTKTAVISPLVSEPSPGTWTNCLRVENALYLSGLTSRANDGITIQGESAYEQSVIIFQKMKNLLEAAGAKMDDITKLTVFVTDIHTNKRVWEARRQFFSGVFPACSLVEVSALATPEILVEIEAVAHIGCGGTPSGEDNQTVGDTRK